MNDEMREFDIMLDAAIRKQRRRDRVDFFFEMVIPIGMIIGFSILIAAVLQAAKIADFGGLF